MARVTVYHPYEIQYSESSNNSTWGAWTALTTVSTAATSGSVTVSPPSTRGYYRRFQVRTRGSAGASYYSGWKVSTNNVRKNTLPAPPTTVTASPATYSTGTITLSWSGAVAGTSAIKQYNIEQCTSTNGTTWGAWALNSTVVLSTTSGSKVITPTTVVGTYTKYRISVTDTLGAASAYKESNSIYCDITPCAPPTSCSVSSTVAEGSVTLSWSGASSGAGNIILSYEIQYSESIDNSAWGAWVALTTLTTTSISGSVVVSPSSTRGYYRRFQVRTRGSAGESYYSEWKISTNTLQKNTLPTAPTIFTASPAVYFEDSITLSWSGAVVGTSGIKQYIIQYATSINYGAWSSWTTLQTVDSSATSGSINVVPSSVAGTYTIYRISITDVLGAVSSYVNSNSIKKNSPPAAPTIVAPKAGSTTYNLTPRILIRTGVEPDGQQQEIWVRTVSGTWQDSVTNADKFSQSGNLGDNIATIFVHEPMSVGNKNIVVKAKDKDVLSESLEVSRSFTVSASPFAEIISNKTFVKA